jgi:nitrate reductase NapE component
MKSITPEQEHLDTIFLTKLTFVLAFASGAMFSFFPLVSIAGFVGTFGFTFVYLQSHIVRTIIDFNWLIEGDEKGRQTERGYGHNGSWINAITPIQQRD